MPLKASDVTPVQRMQFLNILQLLGGDSALGAGLGVLAKLDSDQPLPAVPHSSTAIAIQIPPELFTKASSETPMFGMPSGEVWKWALKLMECALKNIGLAIERKWAEFATAVLTCAFSR